MICMEFLEIGENRRVDWNNFLLREKPDAFLQSFEWGEFQESVRKNIFRFAVLNENEIIAVASVVEHNIRLGMKYWYIPRGPVVSNQNEEVMRLLIGGMTEEAKKSGAMFVRMDPAEKLGNEIFSNMKMKKVAGSVQPKDTLVLNLDLSEEGIMSEMKSKTRYNIRLAEKKGVEIFHGDLLEENFEVFWNLIEETSSRDGIVPHGKVYYRKMLETLQESSNLCSRLYFARYEGKVIAANIVLFFDSYAVYLHGASSNKYRNVMAPYLLQWRQICDAKKRGCNKYDFWGITINNENPRWGGITRFKEGFGGEAIRYIGVYELPIENLKYRIYRLLKDFWMNIRKR